MSFRLTKHRKKFLYIILRFLSLTIIISTSFHISSFMKDPETIWFIGSLGGVFGATIYLKMKSYNYNKNIKEILKIDK